MFRIKSREKYDGNFHISPLEPFSPNKKHAIPIKMNRVVTAGPNAHAEVSTLVYLKH